MTKWQIYSKQNTKIAKNQDKSFSVKIDITKYRAKTRQLKRQAEKDGNNQMKHNFFVLKLYWRLPNIFLKNSEIVEPTLPDLSALETEFLEIFDPLALISLTKRGFCLAAVKRNCSFLYANRRISDLRRRFSLRMKTSAWAKVSFCLGGSLKKRFLRKKTLFCS